MKGYDFCTVLLSLMRALGYLDGVLRCRCRGRDDGVIVLDIGLIVGAERMDSERLNSCSTLIFDVWNLWPHVHICIQFLYG